MKTEPLGDSAWILRDFDKPAFVVAEAIQAAQFPGVFEAVASYETVAIYIDTEEFDAQCLQTLQLDKTLFKSALHEIPVCYEQGEDLNEVADRLGLSAHDVVRLHTSITYRCFAVGFCPGFPYLGYLPEKLSGVPRRPAPRVRVAPGSVALTGRQTGVYPLERPGGWLILGRTPLCLVDVEEAYFPLKPGDEVKFVSVGQDEFNQLIGKRL